MHHQHIHHQIIQYWYQADTFIIVPLLDAPIASPRKVIGMHVIYFFSINISDDALFTVIAEFCKFNQIV